MMRRFLKSWPALLALCLASQPAVGQNSQRTRPPRPTGTRWDAMDVGPFFSSGLEVPGTNGAKLRRPALKGISIKLGAENEAAICFDTERLRWAIGWTGGFLKLPIGREGLEGVPRPVGQIAFESPVLPGWSDKDGGFAEPKPPKWDGDVLVSFGPLPREWAKWRGLHQYGRQVVLEYTVGDAKVLELPGYDSASGLFTRTFRIESSKRPLNLLVSDTKAPEGVTGEFLWAIAGKVKGEMKEVNGQRVLALPALGSTTFQLIFGYSSKVDAAGVATMAKSASLPDLKSMVKGGPTLWNEPVVTKGVLGNEDFPYVVDTITIPEENPWKSWIRASGFDFFKDGHRAALCSVSGDVWIVSGIDGNLSELRWKRYATGLFQPLGLKIVNEEVYVGCRDEIVHLHDLDKNGEADYYENFNNDVAISSYYHEFALNLETDSKGNFYFTKGGNLGDWRHQHHGALLKVSKDGGKLDVVHYGLRAPNGMSVGPHDEITTSDNEGNWVPSSRVNFSEPGKFYGHVFNAHTAVAPTNYDNPIFWLPHTYDLDNSSGGQAWVTSDKWGPFKGDLLHTSYGACDLFKVMMQKVDGEWQGACVKFPLKFESGVMRGRFNPVDGQLYLCGLVVWQSKGPKTGGFQRVRYTGKPVHMPKDFAVKPNGLAITFTSPLDEAAAKDEQNWGVEQWNYKWTQNYGSPEFSVADPNKKGHDPVAIKSIKLSDDKKTVFLELEDVKPVMQMRVKFSVKAADGAPMNYEIYNTINHVPKS
ncbi:MAG TPA: DUF6797 domain-containing protein [Verrucomicrobiae bacterium]|nr:DUF6797 domain-containing protein [Verrucomicrobiae bacterium]